MSAPLRNTESAPRDAWRSGAKQILELLVEAVLPPGDCFQNRLDALEPLADVGLHVAEYAYAPSESVEILTELSITTTPSHVPLTVRRVPKSSYRNARVIGGQLPVPFPQPAGMADVRR